MPSQTEILSTLEWARTNVMFMNKTLHDAMRDTKNGDTMQLYHDVLNSLTSAELKLEDIEKMVKDEY